MFCGSKLHDRQEPWEREFSLCLGSSGADSCSIKYAESSSFLADVQSPLFPAQALQNLNCNDSDFSTTVDVDVKNHWGFSRVPSLDDLLQSRSSENSHRTHEEGVRTRDEGFAQKQSEASTYLHALTTSRVFHSPDSELAMAEALGVVQVYDSLAGSVTNHTIPRSAVDQLRTDFSTHMNRAWSHEALKRGVQLAKQGNNNDALRSYRRALELDPGNCDALVARGAAHANEHRYSEAISDFKAALAIDARNINAAKYLESVETQLSRHSQRLPEAGLYVAFGGAGVPEQSITPAEPQLGIRVGVELTTTATLPQSGSTQSGASSTDDSEDNRGLEGVSQDDIRKALHVIRKDMKRKKSKKSKSKHKPKKEHKKKQRP